MKRARARIGFRWFLPLLLLACQVVDRSQSESGETPSIVVISIDTLRADHLGCYGYFRDTSPTIDHLAAQGLLFTHAVTTMPTTLPAHVSLWTSMYPVQTGVTKNGTRLALGGQDGESARLFAQMLQDIGYTTAAFVSATPVKRFTGIGAGFEIFDQPEPRRGGRSGRADDTTDAVISWLQNQPQRPFFLWIHYFDPHKPYDPPPPFDERFATDSQLLEFLKAKRVPDRENPEILRINNLYDGEIRFVDHQIERLIGALQALGIYDELTLVLVSDHGEGLGQHGRIGHGEIFNEQLFVPLIIRFPTGSPHNGQVVDHMVSLVDVIPTLVETMKLRLSKQDREQFVGRNALSRGRPRDFAFAQRTTHTKRPWGKADKFALVGDDWKYVTETGNRDWLYDMRRDETEIFSLAHIEPDLAADLRERLLADLARYSTSGKGFTVLEETSPEILEELRALGYLN